MFRHFFKTALRTLWKNKIYSSLNIIGLAIGITSAGLIFLWVENEVSYDQFNVNKNNLYFVMVNALLTNNTFTHGSTPGVLGPAIQSDIPGVANTCRTSEGEISVLFTMGNKSVYASGKYAEPSLFSMFTLPFAQGNPRSAFSQIYSLVITQKTALKFFGTDKNVIGQIVRMDNKQDYVISGVLKDIPENSSMQFEWLAPFQIWYQQSPWAWVWGNNCLSTYVQLNPGVNPATINKQLYNFVQKRAPTSNGHVFLFGMNDWHLYNQFDNGKLTGGGQIQYVHLFTVIAWIILLIACINFMNLATARSEKRAREVGVRKVLGSGKRVLIFQFIGEALLMAVLASGLAILLMALTLPLFNSLVQENLRLALFNSGHLSRLLLITLVSGLVAGSYPSLYLSSFQPISVLKGLKIKTGSATLIRKGLVVVQFSVSIILIISTAIIYRQIQHVKGRNLGFNKDNLVELDMQGDMGKQYDAIKQDLLNTGVVTDVALSDHSTIYGGNNTDGLTWEGKPPGNKVLISWRDVSPGFFRTSGMHFLEGRDFRMSDTVDTNAPKVVARTIITQSLAKLLGGSSAIGKTIYDQYDSGLYATVIGVVNDYVYGNMYGNPDPVLFTCVAPHNETIMYVRVKALPNTAQVLDKIRDVMRKDNPAYPFQYQFVDDQFNQMFMSEALISKLSRVFASLAILISCLGLFGLSAYTAERRTREIGVRKVLGASVGRITALLSADFLQLVIISALAAFPISWWIMHDWLQKYSYHITLSWWIFILAGLLATLIALATVCFQSIRAARMNPVKSLRTE